MKRTLSDFWEAGSSNITSKSQKMLESIDGKYSYCKFYCFDPDKNISVTNTADHQIMNHSELNEISVTSSSPNSSTITAYLDIKLTNQFNQFYSFQQLCLAR